jgi:hypothetical protein
MVFFRDRTLWQISTRTHLRRTIRLPIKLHQTLLTILKRWFGVCLIPGDNLPLAVSLQRQVCLIALLTPSWRRQNKWIILYVREDAPGKKPMYLGKSTVVHGIFPSIAQVLLSNGINRKIETCGTTARGPPTAASLRDPVELEANSELGTREDSMDITAWVST